MFSVFKLYSIVNSQWLIFNLIFNLLKLYLLQFKPFTIGVEGLYALDNLSLIQNHLFGNMKLPKFNRKLKRD